MTCAVISKCLFYPIKTKNQLTILPITIYMKLDKITRNMMIFSKAALKQCIYIYIFDWTSLKKVYSCNL